LNVSAGAFGLEHPSVRQLEALFQGVMRRNTISIAKFSITIAGTSRNTGVLVIFARNRSVPRRNATAGWPLSRQERGYVAKDHRSLVRPEFSDPPGHRLPAITGPASPSS
jgi:hypothetical protein